MPSAGTCMQGEAAVHPPFGRRLRGESLAQARAVSRSSSELMISHSGSVRCWHHRFKSGRREQCLHNEAFKTMQNAGSSAIQPQ